MNVFELVGRIVIDGADKAQQQLGTLETYAKKNEQAFKAMRTAGLALVGIATAIGGATLKFGIEAVESENLFTVSMGKMEDAARSWSKELSDALGLNEYELRKNIGVLYTMTKSMGLSEQAAYEMSSGMTELAYDMASFYNLDASEAFAKLRAGITGETEPLKRLGILVDETTVKQYAYKSGIAEVGDELTQQQKVQARYIAILEQTSAAQGDLGRTIDSPTNKLRVLKSNVEETATKFGTALIPMFTKVLDFITPIVTSVGNWIEANSGLASGLLLLVGAGGGLLLLVGIIPKIITGIQTLKSVISVLGNITKINTAIQWLWNVALSANPIGIVIVAITALIAAGIALWKNWDKVSKWLANAWDYIKLAFANAVKFIVNNILGPFIDYHAKILGTITEWVGKLVGMFNKNLGNSIQEFSEKIKNSKEEIAGWADSLADGARESIAARNAIKDTASAIEENTGAIENNVDVLDEASSVASDYIEQIEALAEAFQYAQTIGGKLDITLDDLTTYMLAHGYSVEQIDALYQEFGGDVNAVANSIKVDLRDVAKEMNRTTGSMLDDVQDWTDEVKEAAQDATDARKDALDDQLKAEEKAHNKRLENIQDEYDAKLKAIDDELSLTLDGYQSQIDAIDAQAEAEERAQEEAEYNARVASLQVQIANETDASKRADLQQELAETVADRQQELLAQSRSDQKDAIRQQMEDAREAAELDKDQAETDYDQAVADEDAKYELTVNRLEDQKTVLDTALEQQLARYDTDLENFETLLNDKLRDTAEYVNAYNEMMARLGEEGAVVTAPTIHTSYSGESETPPPVPYGGRIESDGSIYDANGNLIYSPDTALAKYANGGLIPEPTLLTSMRTGQPYAIAGESGVERVTPGSSGSNITFNVTFPNMVVRSETDINKIATELQRVYERAQRTGR